MQAGFAEADERQGGEHVAGAGEEAGEGGDGEGEEAGFVGCGGGAADYGEGRGIRRRGAEGEVDGGDDYMWDVVGFVED